MAKVRVQSFGHENGWRWLTCRKAHADTCSGLSSFVQTRWKDLHFGKGTAGRLLKGPRPDMWLEEHQLRVSEAMQSSFSA